MENKIKELNKAVRMLKEHCRENEKKNEKMLFSRGWVL